MNLIFLSAQPDDYYFLWQLELQLYNFRLHRIHPESVHILIGYDEKKGLRREFSDFIRSHPQVNIHAYPDTRTSKRYSSSIRPHIIAKHLNVFPELEEAAIFYYDSDIVFKELPDFSQLIADDNWYASDTSSYLSSAYIRKTAGEDVFNKMCAVVGIRPRLVEANDSNAGGAQYLFKKTSRDFWQKVETDCEKMYRFLMDDNRKAGFCGIQSSIQAWCTDMWVVWWNALLYKQKFQVHTELNFAWANSPIGQFDSCKILHYTGSNEKGNPKFFRKFDFIHYHPFYTDLSGIDSNVCSIYIKELVDGYTQTQKLKRIDLSDVSFLIMARIDSPERLENIYASVWNLYINFSTNLYLTEIDDLQKIEVAKLPADVQYSFVKDCEQTLHQTKYINQMILNTSTPYISIYDADAILPVKQIRESVEALRSGDFSAASPYDGSFLNVDRLMKAIFSKIQDADFFEENQNKLFAACKRSFGGAVFLNRSHYLDAGLENENLISWGPNDIERIRRLSILGYKIKRVEGNLYHLCHPRSVNSGYKSEDMQNLHMGEYLKISSMRKDELQSYINSWHWRPKMINELER